MRPRTIAADTVSAWGGARMAFGDSGPDHVPDPPKPDSRGDSARPKPASTARRQPSIVSLLIGAVLTLWLVLFLLGH
jgi:hypothetical protein